MRTFLALLALLIPFWASEARAANGRDVNLRIHAIGAILGEFVIESAVAVAPVLSLGPILYVANVDISDNKLDGTGFGAQTTVHFAGNKISDSWVLTAYFIRIPEMDITKRELFTQQDFSASFPNVNQFGLVVGYDWVYDNGFNIGLAAGIRHTNLPETYTLTSASGLQATSDAGSAAGYSAKLSFTLGWAF